MCDVAGIRQTRDGVFGLGAGCQRRDCESGNQPATHRDWILTTVWVVAMDALAIGLVVMVFGSYYMWYLLKRRHALGWIVLAGGFGFDVVGAVPPPM